jgi:hypothetical protein
MDKVHMVAFHHPAMTPVFKKYTTNRTLSIPEKKWVDVALFNILQLYVDASTRQALDPAKIDTTSGVAFWDLLKENALGNIAVNKELAYRRLITTTIKPQQLYTDFVEQVQRNAFICRQSGDVISDEKLVRLILAGLRGAEHQTHVAALLAWQVQNKDKKKILTVQNIQEFSPAGTKCQHKYAHVSIQSQ